MKDKIWKIDPRRSMVAMETQMADTKCPTTTRSQTLPRCNNLSRYSQLIRRVHPNILNKSSNRHPRLVSMQLNLQEYIMETHLRGIDRLLRQVKSDKTLGELVSKNSYTIQMPWLMEEQALITGPQLKELSYHKTSMPLVMTLRCKVV